MSDETSELTERAEDEAKPETASAVVAQLRDGLEQCKRRKKTLVPEWQTNVDYRRGKLSSEDTDDERQPLTIDWALTKAKQAQLYSQTPQVIVTARPGLPLRKAAAAFGARLNDWIGPLKADIGTTMNETTADAINAAGLGAAVVAYETRTQMRDVPVVDVATLPQDVQALVLSGEYEVETTQVPFPTDSRFTITRISPADLLWDPAFRLSDFNKANWVGFTGRMPWALAKVAFGLKEADKASVLSEETQAGSRLSEDVDRLTVDSSLVEYDEVYYRRYLYHEDETSFAALQRVVFVKGKSEPVLNEEWKGQKRLEDGRVIGALLSPVQVYTLTYLSDEAVPPSDSAVGRPQVLDLMDSRADMKMQRRLSTPLRWMDVNRVDPEIQTSLMRGTYQGFIPTNGEGSRAVGEVARSNYPRENFDFDRFSKADLNEAWQIGPNQMGAPNASGEHSASEARISQANFQTRIGQERAQVVRFFLNLTQVLAGLMALYDEGLELPPAEDGTPWDRQTIAHDLVFSIRPDSTVLLDAPQRLDRLVRFLDMTAKSGYVDVEPVIEEMAALSGLDPGLVVRTPEPRGPEPPNISYRYNGEDLMNPVVLAILMKAGQAPTQEELAAAQALLLASQGAMPTTPAPGGAAPPAGGNPAGEDMMPDFQMADRVNRRRETGV